MTTGAEYINETGVSGLSQFGITVEVRFVGCLRKGICNFPPLMCAAVERFYHVFFFFLHRPASVTFA